MSSSNVATSILLVLVAFQQLKPSAGFLFPDLKFRTGASGSPKYRIAILQEEPYMYANGSGYLPELVRHVTQAYEARHGDGLEFDVVSVHTWHQLLTRARTSRWQLALGLVIPSLELTGWSGRQLQTSVPVVYTTLKMVTRTSRRPTEAAAEAGSAIDDGTPDAGEQTQQQVADRVKVIVLRGSPIEYLLVRANNYRGPVLAVDTMDAAVSVLLRDNEDAVLLTDAVVADHLAMQHPEQLESVCPSKLGGSGWLHYSFFGRDAGMIQQLNDIIAPMMSDDSLLGLYTRHFGSQTQHCPW